MNVDAAFSSAKVLLSTARQNLAKIRTEEDAKLQIITRFLTEVLGWDHQDIGSEDRNDNGFSDYRLSDADKDAFVIEAKRIGVIEVATAAQKQGAYKISGPVLKKALKEIEQTASYCHPLGIQLAVLTDGCIWIVFLPWVSQASYKEKQAILFPGFEAIEEDFTLFYELMSKSECKKNTYRLIFDRIHENRLVLDRALSSPIHPAQNYLVQKSALAFNLERVFSDFFSNLTGDDDTDMLAECFVESRESIVADFSLEKITRNVLGNIDPNSDDVEAGLKAVVQGAVAGDIGQTIFIVGPSGAGKSTFLHRFFSKTLPPEIRKACIVVNINALDASSNQNVALEWMTERAIGAIEAQIFQNGYPLWSDLQGLYQLEYLKRSKGSDARLYERDKEAFKDKFAQYVQDMVERDREGYLNRLLKDLVSNRKKLPVFVIDNTDEFSLDYKTKVFQYFQALRRGVQHCLLLFPATDRSAWGFMKAEVFNIYTTRSFFLPTPPPREVFRKRIEYLKNRLEANASAPQSSEYLAGQGIRITIKDLGAFATVVEKVFVEQDYTSKRLGQLSNYNMRKTLGLSKRIVLSAVFKVDDLVRSFLTGSMVAPSVEKFHNALVKGDYTFFKPGDEPLLFPLYQVDSAIRQSPLLHLRILCMLKGLHTTASQDHERYTLVSSILSYFGVMSVPEIAVQRSIEMIMDAGLIEPYDLSKKGYSDDQRISINYSGLAHIEIGMFNPVFFEQMALTTRITDQDVSAKIAGAYNANKGVNARLEEVREIFCSYLIEEDARNCTVPVSTDFQLQREISPDLMSRWGSKNVSAQDMLKVPLIAADRIIAAVDNFDHQRGFGFVNIPDLHDTAFIHASTLEKGNFEAVYDGDEMLCEISRTDRGLMVSKVHEVMKSSDRAYKGMVVKLLRDRQYGFVHVKETNLDAFFHFNLLSKQQIIELNEGANLEVQIKTGRDGRSQVRKILAIVARGP